MNKLIRNAHGERLDYSYTPGTGDRKTGWIVLLGHGVTGNRERPVITDTARALNAAGFDTLAFSFSGNGDSEGDFRKSTISKEVADLGCVLDAVHGVYRKIAYIGHSMGGAVGVLRAAADERIRLLITLAGMINTRNFAETEFGDVIPDKGCMWEDEDCPLSSAFMNDLCETVSSVLPQAAHVRIPWLLIHGTADDVVLPADTEAVRALEMDATDFLLIEGADHSFSEATHNARMTEAVCAWLCKQTGG